MTLFVTHMASVPAINCHLTNLQGDIFTTFLWS